METELFHLERFGLDEVSKLVFDAEEATMQSARDLIEELSGNQVGSDRSRQPHQPSLASRTRAVIDELTRPRQHDVDPRDAGTDSQSFLSQLSDVAASSFARTRVMSDCHPREGGAENKSNLRIIGAWVLF